MSAHKQSAAWFYGQSFNGGTREQITAPKAALVPVQAEAAEVEAEEIESDEPEWSDSDTTREMYAGNRVP